MVMMESQWPEHGSNTAIPCQTMWTLGHKALESLKPWNCKLQSSRETVSTKRQHLLPRKVSGNMVVAVVVAVVAAAVVAICCLLLVACCMKQMLRCLKTALCCHSRSEYRGCHLPVLTTEHLLAQAVEFRSSSCPMPRDLWHFYDWCDDWCFLMFQCG